jgi:hypothetical protein
MLGHVVFLSWGARILKVPMQFSLNILPLKRLLLINVVESPVGKPLPMWTRQNETWVSQDSECCSELSRRETRIASM